MIILAGDIGGTKTWLQILHVGDSGFHEIYAQRYSSAQYASFDDLLAQFLDAAKPTLRERIGAACIGVAGPVERLDSGLQVASVTNLPWRLDASHICRHFDIPRLCLINDFQAVGYGLDALRDVDLVTLQCGRPMTHGPKALIGAGTGLGHGLLVWQPEAGVYDVLPSEAGFTDFAPGTALQRELLNYLAQGRTHVYVEDVLSGRGLISIYQFVLQLDPSACNAPIDGNAPNAAEQISTAGQNGSDPLATRALDLFVSIYANQAANLALTLMATGGVYIAGGIAPKIRARMMSREFLGAFCDKGPMSSLLEKFPLYLVLDTEVGLKGAARVASRL